jgi:hypothetical protein
MQGRHSAKIARRPFAGATKLALEPEQLLDLVGQLAVQHENFTIAARGTCSGISRRLDRARGALAGWHNAENLLQCGPTAITEKQYG